VRRLAVLLAIAACDTPADSKAPARTYVYPPSLAAWPLGKSTGEIGRSQAPQIAMRDGITGSVVGPLRMPTVWQVPGQGEARAIVYGTLAGAHAVELIDIDKGVINWRDTTGCAGPVVGVTDEAVVCADGKGTRALALDGKQRWSEEGATFIAMTSERVVIAGVGEAIVLDAGLGDEVARVKLPAGVAADSIIASCGDAGRELFAYGQDGKLARIAEAKGGPALAWSVPVETVAGIDACDGATVLVTVSGTNGTALVALARETGAVVGRIDGVHGFWPARDGSDRIEVSSTRNVAMYSRDLAQPGEAIAIPMLGELLAKRGELRLVRATPMTAAVLDRRGVRAFIGLEHLGAAIGDRAIIAGSWIGSPGETVHRVAIPGRYRRQLRVSGPGRGLVVPAELRDLPALVDVDAGAVRAKADAGQHGVAAVAIDPVDVHLVYAAALDHAPDQAGPTSVSRFDLKTQQWGWQRADGCGAGTPVGLAVTRELVVCASRDKRSSVRATSRDGSARWEFTDDNVDAVAAAGGAILVHDADRLTVLRASDSKVLATFSSDDGGRMRAAALEIEGMTLVVTAERNRVVAHLPAAHMAPAWSIAIRGVVADVVASGGGVLVALEDGDAYRIDARTGVATAIPGIDLAWRGSGELVIGETAGGPIPPAVSWVPPPPKAPLRPGPVPERDPAEDPPVLPKPWPAPPPMRASWQLALFELTGEVRVHNDYALAEPISSARARASRAPLVVQSGPGLREVLVIEPERGDPLRRVRLPEDAAPGMAFSTIVDGKPLVGTLLANPLRVVLF
jgi:outer membrane protein assembly factor BamB